GFTAKDWVVIQFKLLLLSQADHSQNRFFVGHYQGFANIVGEAIFPGGEVGVITPQPAANHIVLGLSRLLEQLLEILVVPPVARLVELAGFIQFFLGFGLPLHDLGANALMVFLLFFFVLVLHVLLSHFIIYT